MKKQFILPRDVHPAKTYSHAVRAGDTIYLAGNVGRALDGTLVPGGLAEQTQKTLENMQATLEAAGATVQDVVKLNIYLTDLAGMPAFSEVRSRFFKSPMPATTAVQVAALAPGVLIEIDGIAIVDD